MTQSHLRIVSEKPASDEVVQSGEKFPSQLSCTVALQRYEKGALVYRKDSIAVESDIRVLVKGQPEVILSRTPGDDLNLIAGYLFSRSMICTPEDLKCFSFSYQGIHRAEVQLQSSFGIRRIFPSPRPIKLRPTVLFEMKKIFEHRQCLFKNTGSTHAAGLFSQDGELISYGEDVGRHNAFDKALGRALLEGTLEKTAIAMLSSRLALELTVKASTANIPILCGFSAATSSGVQYANTNNLTLVGRLTDHSFSVYANDWRIGCPTCSDGETS